MSQQGFVIAPSLLGSFFERKECQRFIGLRGTSILSQSHSCFKRSSLENEVSISEFLDFEFNILAGRPPQQTEIYHATWFCMLSDPFGTSNWTALLPEDAENIEKQQNKDQKLEINTSKLKFQGPPTSDGIFTGSILTGNGWKQCVFRKGLPNNRQQQIFSGVSKAHISEGIEWEARLLSKLRGDNSKFHVIEGPASNSGRISFDDTLKLLSNSFVLTSNSTQLIVLYQPTLIAPKSFYTSLGIDQTKLKIAICYPDFLMIKTKQNNEKEIIVIDAKGSKSVKLAHKIQITLYEMIVESLLKEIDVDKTVIVSKQAGVWLRNSETWTNFDVTPIKSLVQTTLLRISKLCPNNSLSEIESLPWRLDISACLNCQFVDFCESQANSSHSLSLIHGISDADEEFIEQLLCTNDSKRKITIEDTFDKLKSLNLNSLSIDNRLKVLKILHTLEAYITGIPQFSLSGSAHFSMKDDITVCLCIIQDAPTLKLCGWSMLISFNNSKSTEVESKMIESFKTLPQIVKILREEKVIIANGSTKTAAPKNSNSDEIASSLIKMLFNAFDAISSFNTSLPKNEWQKQISAKLFVFDKLDSSTLETILWNTSSKSNKPQNLATQFESLSLNSNSLSLEKMAQRLLVTFFANKGNLVNCSVLPDITKCTFPYLIVLQSEIDRLLHLKLNALKLSVSDYAIALGLNNCGSTSKLGSCEILEFWYQLHEEKKADAEIHEIITSKLIETVRKMQLILYKTRAILSQSPTQIPRIPKKSNTFYWVPLLSYQRIDEKGAEIEGLSLTRRKCAFLTTHELLLSAEKRRLTRSSLPVSLQLEVGNYILVEYIPETPPPQKEKAEEKEEPSTETTSTKTKKKKKKKEKEVLRFKIIQGDITKVISSADYGWFTKYETDLEKEIDETLTSFTEFRDSFSRKFWMVEDGWCRMSLETLSKDQRIVTLSALNKFSIQGGGVFIFIPATVDWTSPPLFQQLLSQPDSIAEDEVSFESLIENPLLFGTSSFDTKSNLIIQKALELLQSPKEEQKDNFFATMTESQIEAIRNSVTHHLQLIHGPPGTGKTRSLAALTFLLIAAHKIVQGEDDFKIRVLAIALTNSNISHILETMVLVRKSFAQLSGDVAIGRLDSAEHLVQCEDGSFVKPAVFLKNNQATIIGSTVWQIRHAFDLNGGDQFDLILWDDASQSRASELSFPTELIPSARGRLIIAGDPIQLPPIISGDYQHPETNLVPPHCKSLFECILNGDKERKLISVLSENFRMNSGLCGFLGNTIYSQESCGSNRPYVPATSEIASSRLNINLKSQILSQDESFILNPEIPFVVLILKSRNSSALVECPEAKFVANLIKKIKLSLNDQPIAPSTTATTESDDIWFWKNSMIVLSPHHYQKNALLSQLSLLDLESNAVVETVERAQGQERDISIVNYAIFSRSRLLQESEFLFNVNRINVCISRARKKCIFLVSDLLLDCNYPELYQIKGYTFLQQVISNARSSQSIIELFV